MLCLASVMKLYFNLISKQNYLSPPEKTWTYRCIANRCVREHFVNDNIFSRQKRVPFLTCTMTCGTTPNIWPYPTGKLIGSSKSLTFQSHNIRLQISTKFNEVEQLLEDAFDIFLVDLKGMESGNQIDMEAPKRYVASESNNIEQDSDQITHRNRNCDIQNVDVNIVVSQSDVTFVHLDMNESYNLTMKSKCISWNLSISEIIFIINNFPMAFQFRDILN